VLELEDRLLLRERTTRLVLVNTAEVLLTVGVLMNNTREFVDLLAADLLQKAGWRAQ